MNNKMITNLQLSTTEPKKQIQKQTKQTTRTGTESQKWRSHGQLLSVKRRQESGGKGTENKKHKWYIENRQVEVKNNIGNVETKELIYTTHRYELRQEDAGGKGL